MGFSIYNLFKAALLVGNGAAILHPKRVLSQYVLMLIYTCPCIPLPARTCAWPACHPKAMPCRALLRL